MNSSDLKNKIRSNKGATLIFALIALIVCVMISAVIVSTAFSNVGRVKNTQSEEQNYLSVSSAVKLFKDSLEGDSVSYEEKSVATTTETYDGNWETLISSSPGPEETTSDAAVYHDVAQDNTILQEVLKEWAKLIDSPSPQTLTITIEGNDKLQKLAPVVAKLDFDPANMKMTIAFGIKNASSSEADKFITVMTLDLAKFTSDPVTFSKEQKSDNYVKTITVTKKVVHTISWENCVISKKK